MDSMLLVASSQCSGCRGNVLLGSMSVTKYSRTVSPLSSIRCIAIDKPTLRLAFNNAAGRPAVSAEPCCSVALRKGYGRVVAQAKSTNDDGDCNESDSDLSKGDDSEGTSTRRRLLVGLPGAAAAAAAALVTQGVEVNATAVTT